MLMNDIPTIKNNMALEATEFMTVDPKYCHKSERRNAFIVQAKEESPGVFELVAEVDHEEEGFFFDHHIDHIPGMLTACILRQSVLVVSHLFFGIPLSRSFIMDDIALEYSGHAPLGEPIRVVIAFENQKHRGAELRGATCQAKIVAAETTVATGALGFRIFTREAAARLARKNGK